jgi:hypothetical protein
MRSVVKNRARYAATLGTVLFVRAISSFLKPFLNGFSLLNKINKHATKSAPLFDHMILIGKKTL